MTAVQSLALLFASSLVLGTLAISAVHAARNVLRALPCRNEDFIFV
ncbi:MAG: hypothetical protein ABW051_10060 [Burkholderiaceae bacterium]